MGAVAAEVALVVADAPSWCWWRAEASITVPIKRRISWTRSGGTKRVTTSSGESSAPEETANETAAATLSDCCCCWL